MDSSSKKLDDNKSNLDQVSSNEREEKIKRTNKKRGDIYKGLRDNKRKV